MRNKGAVPSLGGLLRAFPLLSVRTGGESGVVVEGELRIDRIMAPHPLPVRDRFEVRLHFPDNLVQGLPKAWETGGRIPRNPEYHVNPAPTCDLCVGNPLRIKLAMLADPSPEGYVEKFVVPYLCGTSVKLSTGIYPQGELGHGGAGLVEDGRELFGLPDGADIHAALNMLTIRKHVADKMPCPCGCGLRLRNCSLGARIDGLRPMLGRAWAREFLNSNGIFDI